MQIEIDLIDDNPYQTRETFTDYSESIKLTGLRNPIIVKPNGSRYILLSGECRLRSVKKLEWKTIECTIKDISDIDAEILSFNDNEEHEKLPLNVRAKAIYNILVKTLSGDIGKNDTAVVSIQLIQNTDKLHNDKHRDNEYDKNLDDILSKIGLKTTQIREALNILTLPEEIQKDDLQISGRKYNKFKSVKNHLDKQISKAKSNEEKIGDTNHIQSKKLINDSEKIEKKLVETIKDKENTEAFNKMSEAIIKAPDDIKLKVIEGSAENNDGIANVILKIDKDKRIDKDDKDDMMEVLINNYKVDNEDQYNEDIDQFKEFPIEIKEAVKDGLSIEAGKNIWTNPNKHERIEIIDKVIHEKPSKQISLTKSNKPKVKEVIINQVKGLKKELKGIETVNIDNIKTYPKKCIIEIIEAMKNENKITSENIKELENFIGEKND